MRLRSLAVAATLVVLLAPSLGRANHDDGDPNSGTFNPQFTASVANPLVDQSSDVTIKLTQDDHEDFMAEGIFDVPGGWQFDKSLPTLRSGETVSHTPASRCDQTVDGLNDGTRGNAHVARAERVGSILLSAHADGISRSGAAGAKAAPTDKPIVWEGDAALVSYDSGTRTAHMCLMLVTNDTRVTSIPDPNPDPNEDDIEGITELTADYTTVLTDTPRGKMWRTGADLTSLAKNGTMQTLNVSLIEFRITYFGTTMGNWNDGRAQFARNPSTDGAFEFVGAFRTCPSNDPSYGKCQSARGGTKENPTWVVRVVPVSIRLPATGKHPIPTLLSPAPYGVVTGTNAVHVTWKEDRRFEQPAGYVLTLARAGETDETRIHRARYRVGSPGYPCAAPPICSVTLHFPLSVSGGGILDEDGKYAVSIVTIFEDGHRSDGRCDNGTALGTLDGCDALVSSPPGWASAEFLLSSQTWSLVYQDSTTFDRRPDGPPTHDVLLIDPAERRFEYVLWHPLGPEEVFAGINPRMMESGGSGVISAATQGSLATGAFSITAVFTPAGAVGMITHPVATLVPPDVPHLPRAPSAALPAPASVPRPFNGTPVV